MADETQVTYVNEEGTQFGSISAMLGHVEVAEMEVGDGTIRKEYRRTIHILRDDASAWGGFDNPQVKGTFIIDGATWAVEDRGNMAIQGQSDSMNTLSLVRKKATNKAYPNLRRYD